MFALKYGSHDPMDPEYISVIFTNYIDWIEVHFSFFILDLLQPWENPKT